MTTLVLGAVGGIVGSFFGGPVGAQIGYLAGSLLGSLLDPPKTTGPRLGDTKLQKSTYGAMIPYCWGAGRIGTIVIDQTDLEEHEETTDSGKGGAESTSFTYSASWIAALCMKLPNKDSAIAGISHLFMDGRLVWAADSDGEAPCDVYTGTETQNPDADFEAINGVGNQPAYRGMAYLKFKDFKLTDHGNRIPNVEAVVFTTGVTGDFPTRVGDEFAPWGNDTPATPYLNKAGFTSSYNNGLITTSWTYRNGTTLEIWVEQHLVRGTVIMLPTLVWTGATPSLLAYTTACTNTHQWMVNGPGPGDYSWVKLFYSVNLTPNSNYAQASIIKGWSAADNDDITGLVGYPNGMSNTNVQSTRTGILYYPARLGSNPTIIARSQTFPVGELWKELADLDPDGGLYAPTDVKMGLGTDDQTVYAMTSFGGGHKLWRFGGRGDYFWDTTDTAGTFLSSANNFFVYQNRWIVFHTSGPPSYVRIVQINADETLEDVGTPLIQGISSGNTSWLGSIYGIDQSGVFKLGALGGGPVILSEIVDDLASLSPALTYDNSALTDEVRWYLIGNQMTIRNALEKLRASFFFDIVEVDNSLVAFKRGEGTTYTIPDEDLDVREYGNEPGDPLQTERKREQELPRTITMTYIDVDLDWQTGAQASPRQVTQSQYDVSLEVAIGFTAQEAAQKCWSIQAADWIERESFLWSLAREYGWLHPAMLVNVRGRDIRIVKVTESPLTGVMKFEGVLAAPSVYTQVAPGAPSQGGGGSQGGPPGSGTGPAGSPGSGGSGGGGGLPGDPGYRPNPRPDGLIDPWFYMLIDCPALHATDAPFGFYHSVTQAYGSYYWGGADLYRTTDNGETYHYLGTKKGSSVLGSMFGENSIVGEPDYDVTLLNSSYAGGDVTQEVTVLLWTLNPFHVLTSATEAALDAGANLIYVSTKPYWGNPHPGYSVTEKQEWECMQFRDVVALTAQVWRVTGWRRGRRGTPVLNHGVNGGDGFFFPETVANIVDAQENIGMTFTYKTVPYGAIPSICPPFQFTNYGQSGGGSNAGGGAGGGGVTPPTAPGGGNAAGTGSFDTIALNFPITVFKNTTTSRTLVSGERASLITFNNVATTTVTLPDNLPKKWWCFIENVGAGDVVLDPVGGSPACHLDNSLLSLTVTTNHGLLLVFDGVDYWTSRGMGGGSSGLDLTNAPLYTAGPFDGLQHARVLTPGSGITFTEGGGSPPSTMTIAKLNDYIVLTPAYAATVTVDLTTYATYGHIQVDVGVLTGNVILNITNGTNGQIIRVRFKQDGTGGRILSGGGNISTSTDLALPLLSTAANAIDLLGFQWDGTSGNARLVAYVRGFT